MAGARSREGCRLCRLRPRIGFAQRYRAPNLPKFRLPTEISEEPIFLRARTGLSKSITRLGKSSTPHKEKEAAAEGLMLSARSCRGCLEAKRSLNGSSPTNLYGDGRMQRMRGTNIPER